MDLFQSPEVYIMKNQSFFKENGTFRGPKSYNPYLLPVTVDVKSIKEFKNRYNKDISSVDDLLTQRESNEELPEDVSAFDKRPG